MKKMFLLTGILAYGVCFAQTETHFLGNLIVEDDPDTTGYVEGNVQVTGGLVLGNNTNIASGVGSIAGGSAARALGSHSIAVGSGTTLAESPFSIAYGKGAIASSTTSDHNFAIGYNAQSTGGYSYALGINALASVQYSVAIGYRAQTLHRARFSMAIGPNSIVNGYESMALGNFAETNGDASLAIGSWAKTGGHFCYAFGYKAYAGPYFHTYAFGYQTQALAASSLAIGFEVTTDTFGQTTMGRYNAPITGSKSAWVEDSPLFVIGNGMDAENKSNALVMLKNGDTNFSGHIEAEGIKVRTPRGGITMGAFGRN